MKPYRYSCRSVERAVAVLLVCVACAASAQEHSVTFSTYSHTLKLQSIDEKRSTAVFGGSVTATGTLFFEFDEGDAGTMVGVNFAKFVPDRDSLHLLPSVIKGYYPGPVRYVLLEPADAVLIAAVGADEATRLSHGTVRSTSLSVKVIMSKYTASVDCDARSYFASVVAVERLRDVQVGTLMDPPHGC